MKLIRSQSRIAYRWHSLVSLILCAIIFATVGCSRLPSRVHPPKYSNSAGADAISTYDTNGDQKLSEEELEAVGSLKASLVQVDTNTDRSLTADEIDARVQSWVEAKIGEMTVTCQVLLDGEPFEGAKLTFEPEPFLGNALKPAKATTRQNGDASVSMAKEHLSDPRYDGVACGWYKIRVDMEGRDIPARYNTETILGCEVAMDAHWTGADTIVINVKRK